MTTHPLSGARDRSIAETPVARKPIELPTDPAELERLFLRALFWGVDESVTASRGGWPR